MTTGCGCCPVQAKKDIPRPWLRVKSANETEHLMKPFALAAAAAGAVVALAACSHSATTSAGPATSPTVTPSPTQVNCSQRYDAWRHGPAKKLIAAIDAVDAAGKAHDLPARKAAVKKAGRMIAGAVRHPIPACADPRGYWTALLMHVNAAAGSASSGPGRASITLALKGVSTLKRELSAELRHTAG